MTAVATEHSEQTGTRAEPTRALQPAQASSQPPAEQSRAAPPVLLTHDESQFANLLDTARFNHIWRVAQMFAKSKIVPAHFQNEPENCFIAVQMAVRLGVDPFMFMQKTYIVQGKPGMEAQLAIALVNARGPFTGPIQWILEGEGTGRYATAFAIHKSTGQRCECTVSMEIAAAEGWLAKGGSKWKTMPDQMLRYRSAAWLARLYAPECLMGMETSDELEDRPRYVESTSGAAPLGEALRERAEADARDRRGLPPVEGSDTTAQSTATIVGVEHKATPTEPSKPAAAGAAPSPAEATKIGLVEALMNNQNCDAAKAEKKLTSFAKTLCQGRTLDTLTPDDVKALHKHIAAGDIVVPK